ncbi:P-loop containing nucleoside triphosphate hydrolase protein [Conidiobolus coronatus NRRL 28638]|uniref:p-loop containing nucleoside triphosphate hydrolase protein n=1 Tax=Conidiobolus coronatus (strain ATCC 28846 / CBS 209.66 / NRRL 28638) TaxID=796925 RepID=A0A137NTB3_CONC2|nr:P-loop containing nucleoside triphosphate hydrolase protein [Conidiobolus coronatus NRRL 28638]|eukprot:KXN65951.1 P-loop containing nucleoside triphosphate hydrolase protein [Conidiobolus coronatus NRRL 28638]
MNIFEILKNSLVQIEKMIDFDSSIENGKIIIKEGIDEVLDQLKSIYNQLDQILNEEAINFKNTSGFKLQKINIVYYPQLGHLICTPISEELLQNGYQIPELEFIFCSSEVCYYKNSRMRLLDEEYGDVYNLISDREIELYEAFKTEFKSVHSDIKKAIDIVVELDCILSFAKAAKKYNLTRPNLINRRCIVIKNGRNLLVESFKKCIENDCIWDYTNNRGQVYILKGPNASGKSVYLQLIVTIVYLCQIGSFVPAQAAQLPVIDQLFTIFTTDESMAQVTDELSTFYQDLSRGFNILEKSTQNSLVVIDEFGKGTNLSDGIGLLCALIIELLNKEENCPFTILTTHFQEIKKYFNEEQLQGIHWLRTEADICQKNMKYYFKIAEGSESQSWGIRFAEEYGLDKSIIARAKYFQNKVQNMELPVPEISQELNKRLGLNRQTVDIFLNTEFNEDNFDLFRDYINKFYG